MTTRLHGLAVVLVFGAVLTLGASQNQAPATAQPLSDAEMEHFLSTAHQVGRAHGKQKGVTGTERVTLSDGTLTHDAQVQTIDVSQQQFQTPQGIELNFRDSWKYNVATYRIDRLLGMNMVPVTVKRTWGRAEAAVTWWIDDVMMDEGERIDKKMQAPEAVWWNQQVQIVRVLDQLIANVDRNAGNLLITKDWRVWAIDHTRAFRLNKTLKTPQNVTRCDRSVVEKLRALDRATLDKTVGDVLTGYEIQALLARRDQIIAIFDKAGPGALFDR